MKQYIKNGYIESAEKIITKINGTQTINPTHEQIINDGWIEYVKPQITKEQKLEELRQIIINNIIEYDSSDNINLFTINGIPIWLDKSTRAGLKLRFEAEKALGKTNTTLWYENMQFSLLLDDALQLLFAIEVYASACYDNTQKHLSNVSKLTTLEALKNYNYKADYPEKLNVEL